MKCLTCDGEARPDDKLCRDCEYAEYERLRAVAEDWARLTARERAWRVRAACLMAAFGREGAASGRARRVVGSPFRRSRRRGRGYTNSKGPQPREELRALLPASRSGRGGISPFPFGVTILRVERPGQSRAWASRLTARGRPGVEPGRIRVGLLRQVTRVFPDASSSRAHALPSSRLSPPPASASTENSRRNSDGMDAMRRPRPRIVDCIEGAMERKGDRHESANR